MIKLFNKHHWLFIFTGASVLLVIILVLRNKELLFEELFKGFLLVVYGMFVIKFYEESIKRID